MRSNKKEGGVRKAGWFHTFALVLYRSPLAFSRLIPTVGLSWESLNASLYVIIYLRALFLLVRAGGAVKTGGGKSYINITSSLFKGSFKDIFKVYLSRSNYFIKVIYFRVILL
jgi:hypothetical protein